VKPFDLQVNGYAGVDFCSSQLTGEELEFACRALKEDGVDSILATIITDSLDRMEAKLARLVTLRKQSALAKKMIAGLHIEGPFISPKIGYVGAHSVEAVVGASEDGCKRLLEAAGGLTRVFTLAPECDPGFATTRYLSDQGVTVSAGHCDPALDTLHRAIDNGLAMVTHFGNGCPVDLPRHDNVLHRFLHFRDRLWFCFIPDGAHVDFVALKNYMDFIGIDRSIAVTDAICASRLGPGRYELSGMQIEVDDNGVARRPGSQNLAGSTVTMPQLQKLLAEELGFSESEIEQLVDRNPRSAIER